MRSCRRGTSTQLASFRVARVGEQRQRVVDKLAHRGKTGSIRKPSFSPLNYGDDDLEIINGLNGCPTRKCAWRHVAYLTTRVRFRLSASRSKVLSTRGVPFMQF